MITEDLSIFKGDSEAFTVSFSDVSVDPTAWNAKFIVKEKYTSAERLLDIDGVKTEDNSQSVITLTSEITGALTAGTYVFGIQLIISGTEPSTVYTGQLTVNPAL